MTLVQKEIKRVMIYKEPYTDYSAMQGPCPEGFHVPSKDEWTWVYNIGIALWARDSSSWARVRINLHMPFVWRRNYSDGSYVGNGTYGTYWSSTYESWWTSYAFEIRSSTITPSTYPQIWYAHSIRPFKDRPIKPNWNWDTIFQWSWNSWIYHNSTLWLISMSSDWTTWITISDKNLWATTVYNSWDTLSNANCWNLYQWGNNYWFPRTWTISTSSTQVNTSWYWPGNYYNSSTFVKLYNWTSANLNLRWWVTWAIAHEWWEIQIWPVEKGWQPWVNTLLYLPMNSTYTYTDQSWNNVQTTNYSVSFGTYQWVDCGYFNRNHIQITPFVIPANITVLCWVYYLSTSDQADWKIFDARNNSTWIITAFERNPARCYIWADGVYAYGTPRPDNQWVLFCWTMDSWWNRNLLVKWNGVNISSSNSDTSWASFTPTYTNVWNEWNNWAPRYFMWYMSNLIVESKVRTAADVANYYNQTKANYWIS